MSPPTYCNRGSTLVSSGRPTRRHGCRADGLWHTDDRGRRRIGRQAPPPVPLVAGEPAAVDWLRRRLCCEIPTSPDVFLNLRGLYLPRPVPDAGFGWVLAALAVALIAWLLVAAAGRRRRRRTAAGPRRGRPPAGGLRQPT